MFIKDEEMEKVLEISENIRLGELIFQGIADYGFMHSSPFINNSLLAATALGEEFANAYMAASFKSV